MQSLITWTVKVSFQINLSIESFIKQYYRFRSETNLFLLLSDTAPIISLLSLFHYIQLFIRKLKIFCLLP